MGLEQECSILPPGQRAKQYKSTKAWQLSLIARRRLATSCVLMSYERSLFESNVRGGGSD